MKVSCEIIRDLLPLYADEACSEGSRIMVDEHLRECTDCTAVLDKLRRSEIEDDLKEEKEKVISYGEKKFRKQSATVGSTVSGAFMIPILAALVLNLVAGSGMGWFLIVLAGMAVAASLILVPIFVRKDKAFWMFCAFTASLILLLAVICLVSRGDWFWVASGAVLFGLSVIFLPFVVKAKPLEKWIGGMKKAPLVLTTDAVLFLNMMNTIRLHNRGGGGFLLTAGCAAGITLVILYILKNRGKIK